jgi:hypothetical protein
VSFLVPDSIEPYCGYKALQIVDGHLVSPSRFARWPKHEPLESTCQKAGAAEQRFEWVLVPAPEGWEDMFWVPAKFLREGTTTHFGWPSGPPPEGMTWVPKPEVHHLTGCTCGIYVVETTPQLHGYLSGPDHVIVWIAVWGEVVLGARGARGQYAYPQKIWAAEQQWDIAVRVADEYGIPVEIVRFLPKEDE